MYIFTIAGLETVAYCAEEWGEYKRGRLIYSIFIFVVQFMLPVTLISLAHYSIKRKLQKMPSWQKARTQMNNKIATEQSSRGAKSDINGSVLNKGSSEEEEEEEEEEGKVLLLRPDVQMRQKSTSVIEDAINIPCTTAQDDANKVLIHSAGNYHYFYTHSLSVRTYFSKFSKTKQPSSENSDHHCQECGSGRGDH